MSRRIIKAADDKLFNEAVRRAIMHGRALHNSDARGRLGRTLEALNRERSMPEEHFLYRTETPRFVGGTTGRSGTKWLIRTIQRELEGDPVVIGEHGMFVLSLFREAPYEYYQFGGENAAVRREKYLDYFLHQVGTFAFRRRKLYGSGLKGMIRYIPHRAIDLAGDKLRSDLQGLTDFGEIKRAFGDFYLALHNYHAAILHGGPAEWLNKEPPYGRHADALVEMIPNARLVVMARDGRASALSMYKRQWMATVRGSMERWYHFAGKTADAVERCPKENVLLLKYEDMVTDFEGTLSRVFDFFRLPAEEAKRIARAGAAESAPREESLHKWKSEVSKEDLRWFEENCSDIMRRLGYEM